MRANAYTARAEKGGGAKILYWPLPHSTRTTYSHVTSLVKGRATPDYCAPCKLVAMVEFVI